jgi:uncharacterized iron-regulated protein
MRWFVAVCIGAVVTAAPFALAQVPLAAQEADVVFLGEVHDNPAHHMEQAEWVRALAPVAIVFEMLPQQLDQAAIAANRTDPDALADLLDWEARGWPDFAIYYPIFQAAADAEIRGADVRPDQVRGLMTDALGDVFGARSGMFGLDAPLPENQQAAREAMQFAVHCDALPMQMLPTMVNVQRLRDAALADAALSAHSDLAEISGGPVVVITGNGHARKDWGAPAALAHAAPGIVQFSLGQSESGQAPDGVFDMIRDAPAVDRPDPCDVFRTKN